MKIRRAVFLVLLASLAGTALRAQEATPPAKPLTEAEQMAKMLELAQPGEHHRQLAELAGTWDYKVKFAGAPGAELAEAGKGTAVRTAVMGGRYYVMNVTGKMLMPGTDGQVKDTDFQGMSVDAYDNVKQQFVSTWIDSMGTSITLSEGTYDAPAKTFTYRFEMEVLPGVKVKARQVVKIVDADHHQLDWYETHGGQEAKTMEIDYARRK